MFIFVNCYGTIKVNLKSGDIMNVYDFDKTIYNGDSTFHFLLYCAKKYPAVRKRLPSIGWNGIKYICGALPKQQFKEVMFSFLSLINVDKELELFWQEKISGIKKWYLDQQREDDVVISASPEFLVKHATEMIGIKYIMASPVDKNTGKYYGANCHGREKVERLYQRFPGGKIEEFYSDSYSDSPLAALAEKAFLVKNNKLLPWRRDKL